MTATTPEHLYMAYPTLWKRHIPKEQFIMGHGRYKFSCPLRYTCCVSLSGPSRDGKHSQKHRISKLISKRAVLSYWSQMENFSLKMLHHFAGTILLSVFLSKTSKCTQNPHNWLGKNHLFLQ